MYVQPTLAGRPSWKITFALALVTGMLGAVIATASVPAPIASTATNMVQYSLFKISPQISNPQSLVGSSNSWTNQGYSCQTANSEQIALGLGPQVCGYTFTTAVHNTITDAGIDSLIYRMAVGQSVNTSTVANIISLSTDSGAPSAADCKSSSVAGTDCLLTGTINATSGFSPVYGTVAYSNFTSGTGTNPTTTYTITHTFTAGATVTGVQKAALYDSKTVATITEHYFWFENTFSSVNMNSGDTLALTWTVTV